MIEKAEYKSAQNQFIEYRGKLREHDKEEERKRHENYIKQCEENGKLQDAKDRMYKQYFQNFDQSMTSRAR